MKSKIAHILAIVFALAAAYVSALLLQKHMQGSTSAVWFEAGCSDDKSTGAANCAAVLQSPYSYIPPKFPNDTRGGAHFPSAFVGLVYFSAIAVWLIGVGRPSWKRRNIHLVPITWVALGLIGSGYFLGIMFTKLDQWCPWCLVTHGLNLLIGIALLVIRPRPDGRESTSAPSTPTPQLYPSGRVVFLTLAAAGAIAFAQLSLLGLRNWRKQADTQLAKVNLCKTELDRIRKDAGMFIERWQGPPLSGFKLRPDDPTRGGLPEQQTPFSVVVFSDFECPMCKRVAAFLEDSVAPLFGGNLTVTYKHFPLHRDCNPRTKTTMHPRACEAARLAEAARIVGGNDAFWRAHDYLFRNQSTLERTGITATQLASAINVKVAALQQASASPSIQKRIDEDIDLGLSAGLRGTPLVVANSRVVDRLVVRDIGFWDAMADAYWKSIGKPRPPSTKPTPTSPTANSLGRKVAP